MLKPYSPTKRVFTKLKCSNCTVESKDPNAPRVCPRCHYAMVAHYKQVERRNG